MADIIIRFFISTLYGPYLWVKYILQGEQLHADINAEEPSDMLTKLNYYQLVLERTLISNEQLIGVVQNHTPSISEKIEKSVALEAFEKDYCYDVLSFLGGALTNHGYLDMDSRVLKCLTSDLGKIKERALKVSESYSFDIATVENALRGHSRSIIDIFIALESK